jgi:hypothetical protein
MTKFERVQQILNDAVEVDSSHGGRKFWNRPLEQFLT